jgi:hypothetical protein
MGKMLHKQFLQELETELGPILRAQKPEDLDDKRFYDLVKSDQWLFYLARHIHEKHHSSERERIKKPYEF